MQFSEVKDVVLLKEGVECKAHTVATGSVQKKFEQTAAAINAKPNSHLTVMHHPVHNRFKKLITASSHQKNFTIKRHLQKDPPAVGVAKENPQHAIESHNIQQIDIHTRRRVEEHVIPMAHLHQHRCRHSPLGVITAWNFQACLR